MILGLGNYPEMTNKYTKPLQGFSHLWKTDDEQWVAQRKAQWEYIVAHNFDPKDSETYKRLCGKYFIYGEKDEQHLNLLYFLTPIDSAATAKQLYDSELFVATEKKQLMVDYILMAMKFGAQMPWLKQNIRYFVEGVIGNEYKKLEMKSGRRMKVISPAP